MGASDTSKTVGHLRLSGDAETAPRPAGAMRRDYALGTTVLAQGDPLRDVMVLQSGTVAATVYTADGAQVWLDEYGPGDWVGTRALISPGPSPSEWVAQSDMVVWQMSATALADALDGDAALARRYAHRITQQLARKVDHLIAAKTLAASGRICLELRRRSRPIGIEAGQFVIRPTPIFSDIALRAGSTRETVSRLVSALCKTGHLERRTGALVIPDMEAFDSKIM